MEPLKFTDEVRQAVSEVLTDLLNTESDKADAKLVERYTSLVEEILGENLCHANEQGGSELVVVEGMVKAIFSGTHAARRSILQKWLWAYMRAEQNIMEEIQAGHRSDSPVTNHWYIAGFASGYWMSEFAWGRRYLHFREFHAEMDRIYTVTNSVDYVAQELGLPVDAARVMLHNRGLLISQEPLSKLDESTRRRVTLAIAAWSLKMYPDVYDEDDDWYAD